jgi:hypothetical protein
MIDINPSIAITLYVIQWTFILFLGALVLGAYNQIDRLERGIRSQDAPSRLREGERLPDGVGITLPARAFLIVFSYGCAPCVELSKRLDNIRLGDWSLIALAGGKPIPREQARIPELRLPGGAQHIYDPEFALSNELKVYSTPTALAFVDGRLIAQQIAPNLEWFERVAKLTATRTEGAPNDETKEVLQGELMTT